MDISDKLYQSWMIIKWLDDARWSEKQSEPEYHSDIFNSLKPSDKILTHWLAYITDLQRPWKDVWFLGLPVLSGLVESYIHISDTNDINNLLKLYTTENTKRQEKDNNKIDTFHSEKQKNKKGEKIKYTPRYGHNLVSIARVLYNLSYYNKNIVSFLSSNIEFIFSGKDNIDDSVTSRIAYLLYLISYNEIPSKGFTSYHRQSNELDNYIKSPCTKVIKQLNDKAELEDLYHKWLNSKKRFHKRLWAALRDYIRPGSIYKTIFLQSLKDENALQIYDFITKNQNEMLTQLELPGDVWNLNFNKYLFGQYIKNPGDLRKQYHDLVSKGYKMQGYYPEQFDVSWDFAPRMCNEYQESICPFKNTEILIKYCHNYNSATTINKRCPITKILCGYTTDCHPNDCPIRKYPVLNLCTGCSKW